MNEKTAISPELASGFKDYLPEDMIPRQRMFDIIRSTFERFGFVPLDTPCLEKEAVLTGGDPNFRMQIFRAGLRTSNEGLALRFDLTVPLARVVSSYGDKLEKPFKRYQIGKVWRGEKPQAGRFREFVQFDADIVGSNKTSADAEIIAVMYETLVALGLTRFEIKVNNRKILNGLPSLVGYEPTSNTEVLRIIDKLDKIGWNGVKEELREKLSLGEPQMDKLKRFIEIRSDSPRETLTCLGELCGSSTEIAVGASELSEIINHLKMLGVPDNKWRVDLSVARGLGYYTGPVFETSLLDIPEIGSVFSGGRFDDLVARFGERSVPATGASVGVDRLFAAMEKLGLIKKERAVTQVFVLNFDVQAEDYCQEIVSIVRKAGFRGELYLGKETSLKGQLSYATKQETPVVIIAGGTEKTKRTAQVKNMAERQQVESPFSNICSTIQTMLTSHPSTNKLDRG